ncbi:MAG: glycosyltransferase family 4 protein [Pseudomonadota bacterium]
MTHDSQFNGPVWQLVDSRGIGGIESHVKGLSQALSDIGVDSRIVRINDYGAHPVFEKDAPVKQRALNGVADTMARICLERPLLVHTHGYKAGIIGRLAARASRVPVVSTFHAGDRGAGLVRVYTFLDEATARLSPAMAVSEKIKTRIPHARFAPNFTTVPPTLKDFHDGPVTFGFVGRFSEEKGVDRFCALARSLPEARFIAFGDGPLAPELKQRFSDCVAFAGVELDQDAIWSKVDVVCLPSRAEGLPMTALEAAARGVPILATPVGGLPDLLEAGGGWVADFVHDVWKERMRAIAALPPGALACIGEQGRAIVESQFSPAAGLDVVLSVYAEAGVRIRRHSNAA